ncbi:MAG: hypothetical protein GDA43_17695 [Hormoscilla sp. SP5CHS1]|nr:hypothetical protein [Hormoscilla sp. SP5CHS1]
MFDYAVTLQKLLSKLVRSYALDAIDAQQDNAPTPKIADASELLQTVTKVECKTFPATGMGEDVRLTGGNITGGASIANDRVVHLGVFLSSEEEQNVSSRTTLSRASVRRMNRS